MIDEKKIILMTKLAIYEKNNIKQDKKKTDYFVEDYVYINNLRTRLSITVIMGTVAVVGAIMKFSEILIFPMSLEELIAEYLMVYIVPWLVLMIIYTFISTLVYGKIHYKAKRNYKNYINLMKQLDRYEASKGRKEGE